jgi:hypothetical protein
MINPLNAELNSICPLLALLQAHHILHVSGVRVNSRVFEEDLKMCEQWIMSELLYTKQSASLQIAAVVWFATSCSLDVDDRKQVRISNAIWIDVVSMSSCELLRDGNVIRTTGIQTNMDFDTRVLTFLHFTR